MPRWKVLVVDDQKEIRENLQDQLRLAGFKTELAKNVVEAEFKIAHTPFDIAILDIMLPDGNGIDLYRKIKEINPDIYTIMITGNATVETTILALNEGVNSFLVKPFSNEQFQAYLIQATRTLKLKAENRALFQEIQKNRQFYEDLLNSSSEAILVVDLDFNIRYSNQATLNLFQVTQDQLVNEPLSNFIEDGYKILSHIYQQLTLGKSVAGYRVGIKIGETSSYDAHLTADFLHDAEGRVEGLIINLSNTMIHSELFNRILRKEKLATIIHLANAVGHEIRNPINILYGRLQLLAEEINDDNFQRAYQSIRRQINRLLDITELLGKFNFRKEDSIPHSVSLRELLEEKLTEKEATFRNKNISVIRDYTNSDFLVEGNRTQFLDAIGYLLDAIEEYSTEGTQLIIKGRESHTYSEIPWYDLYFEIPGFGLTAEQILDPYKGDDLRTNGMIDMGLTIMHMILNNYGARVDAFDSEEGTVIRLQFPVPGKEKMENHTPNDKKARKRAS